MARTVTIKTPPTFFVTDGPDLTFDLPLVPRADFSGGAGMLVYLVFAGLVGLWVLSFPASWILAAVLGWSDFRTDKLLFGLFFLAWALAIISPAIEAGLKVAFTLFSRRPVLEIRPEGLIDRRALKRLVRWEEFESVGDRRHMAGAMGMPAAISFRLKARDVRRFSPISMVERFMRGGYRVVIFPYGFDIPPRVILDVILAMIRTHGAASKTLPKH